LCTFKNKTYLPHPTSYILLLRPNQKLPTTCYKPRRYRELRTTNYAPFLTNPVLHVNIPVTGDNFACEECEYLLK